MNLAALTCGPPTVFQLLETQLNSLFTVSALQSYVQFFPFYVGSGIGRGSSEMRAESALGPIRVQRGDR